jgi:hypothetical protein
VQGVAVSTRAQLLLTRPKFLFLESLAEVTPVGVQAASHSRTWSTDRSGYLLNLTIDGVTEKPKHSLLPVLVILFLVSYGLMTLLIVEQGRTIDSQRTLIHQLLIDSFQLSALRGQAIQKEHAAAKVQPKEKAQTQTPSPQVRPRDFQAQTPSAQVTPNANAGNARDAGKIRRPAPRKPPRYTSDNPDIRRTLNSI